MAERTPEQQAAFAAAVEKVGSEDPLTRADEDALSVLLPPDVERLRETWAGLAACARERLVRSLHAAAEKRLSLDYSPVNQMALDDGDPEVRLAAVESALEDHSEALLRRLAQMVRGDPDIKVRRAAAEGLSRFALLAELDTLGEQGASLVRTTLFEVLQDEREESGVRARALAAIGYFSDSAATDKLAEAFRDPNLRWGAVRGMGRSADPNWTDRLLPVLGSEDEEMRVQAARALGEIEDERAIRPLVEIVDDPDMEVRLAAIKALGNIGGEEVREALFYLLEDPDEAIREAAEKAMQDVELFEDPLEL